MGKPKKKKLDRLWQAAADPTSPSRFDNLLNLAEYLVYHSAPDEAAAVAREAVEAASSVSLADDQGASYLLAVALDNSGRDEEALDEVSKAIARLKEEGNAEWLALCLWERGTIELKLDQHFAALTSLCEAIDWFEWTGRLDTAAHIALEAAEIAEDYWDTDNAARLATKAIEHYRELKDYKELIRAMNFMTRLMFTDKQYATALGYAESTMALAEYVDNLTMRQDVQLLYGRALIAFGDYSKAIRQLIEVTKVKDNAEQRANGELALGYLEDAYTQTGRLEEAAKIAKLRKALGT